MRLIIGDVSFVVGIHFLFVRRQARCQVGEVNNDLHTLSAVLREDWKDWIGGRWCRQVMSCSVLRWWWWCLIGADRIEPLSFCLVLHRGVDLRPQFFLAWLRSWQVEEKRKLDRKMLDFDSNSNREHRQQTFWSIESSPWTDYDLLVLSEKQRVLKELCWWTLRSRPPSDDTTSCGCIGCTLDDQNSTSINEILAAFIATHICWHFWTNGSKAERKCCITSAELFELLRAK